MSTAPAPAGSAPDLLVLGGRLVTQDAERRCLDGYGVAATKGLITEIAPSAELKARWPHVPVLDASDGVVIPGLVDAHQHLTGDPLVRSLIPDDITSDQAIFDWATPLHAALTGDDDELGATLTAVECLRYGTTTLIEAGTVAHPDRVAAGMLAAGVRGGVGCWGWDTPGLPFSAPAAEVLARQAAVLRAKLPVLDAWNARRARIAAIYADGLAATGLELPATAPGATHAWHLYVVRHPRRDALQAALQKLGIGTLIHYPIPPFRQQAYAAMAVEAHKWPIAERLANEVLSLPMGPHLPEGDAHAVVAAVREALVSI